MRRRLRATDEPSATRHTGGRQPLLDAAALALSTRLLREQNDLTLSELCERVSAGRGVRVSVPTMSRAPWRLGLPHKKS
ncbi:MAG TPA: hypothetical protein VF297_10705 [Pyrinomonadaceae bacterium]